MKLVRNFSFVIFSMLVMLTPVLAQTMRTTSSSQADGAAGIFFILFYCCICIFILISVVIFIYLIIDAFQRDYGADSNMLLVSLLLLIFLGFPVGAIIYYFIVMKKYPKKS